MRKPAVAGSFYPTEGLKEMISQFFEKVKCGNVENGMIVPHAGYIYSGKTAAVGYKSMLELLRENKKVRNIIILGPSHQFGFNGILCDKNDSWKTPLGEIKLKKFPEIKDNEEAHSREHSIEVQVPFIQYVAEELGREITITPLLVGELTNMEVKRYAEAFSKIENCFFVVSSDLSHYLNFAYAQKLDKETINKIINYNSEKLEACGRNPLRIIIEMAKIKKWEFKLLDYSTSADASGDKGAVVGYAAIGF